MVVYLFVADQRRTARLTAAALSRVLGREVEIARVPQLSPGRVVLEGLRLPAGGGWPAEIRAQSVEATGSLVAAATGERGPVTVVIRKPTITLGTGGAGGPGGGLEGLGDTLAALLAPDAIIDASLIGGSLEQGQARAEFDLAVKKDAEATRADLVVRGGTGPPLTVTALARLDAGAARVEMRGTGSLAPLGPWLAPAGAALLVGPPVDMALVVTLPRAGSAGAPPGAAPAGVDGRGRLALGDLLSLEAEGAYKDGLLRLTIGRLGLDLGLAAAAAELPWRPVGKAELTGATVSWRPGAGGLPAVAGALRVPALALPAGAVGPAVEVTGIEARLDLVAPALRVEARADRLRVAGVEAAALVRGRLTLTAGARPTRVEVDEWQARVPGGTLTGVAAYDVERGRLSGRAETRSTWTPRPSSGRWGRPGWRPGTGCASRA